MTVGDLIAALEQFDRKQRVLVDGYEDGFTEPSVREVHVVEEPDPDWWVGEWTADIRPEGTGIPAVVVSRS